MLAPEVWVFFSHVKIRSLYGRFPKAVVRDPASLPEDILLDELEGKREWKREMRSCFCCSLPCGHLLQQDIAPGQEENPIVLSSRQAAQLSPCGQGAASPPGPRTKGKLPAPPPHPNLQCGEG